MALGKSTDLTTQGWGDGMTVEQVVEDSSEVQAVR